MLGVAGGLLSPAARVGPAEAPQRATQRFRELARTYLEDFAAFRPEVATEWGLHAHDRALPNLEAGAIERRAARVSATLARLERIDRGALRGSGPAPQPEYFDHRLLEYALRDELLELRDVRTWQRNPVLYNTAIASGIAFLVDRGFAPLPKRLEALIARCEQVPRVVAAARENLRDVPELWARRGAEATRGTASFLRTDLLEGLQAQGLGDVEPSLAARWRSAHASALSAVEAFAAWQETELLPRARGDYRLGRERLQRKVLYGEHVTLSIDQLREMNAAAIRDYQERVRREAARVDPGTTPQALMEAMSRDFPAPDQLVDAARSLMAGARQHVIDRRLLTLPSDSVPIVRPTPSYARGGPLASTRVPGPFETVATEAYYNLTPPDPAWDDARVRQHMTYFNRPGLLGITVHEAFSGHFVQLLYRQHLPSDLRKVLQPWTLVEGWAHYTEQMMVDEGLGGGDPRVRLGQLRRALQRHARWYASLALHAFGEPLEDVARRFQEIAYFAEFPARRETERGTEEAVYLSYALGRMQILDLREEVRREAERTGSPFSLREFHDRFLRLGLPPELAREALLGRPAP